MENTTLTETLTYKIADIKLADWGRKEIELAETEMPGLMALREEIRCRKTSQGSTYNGQFAHDSTNSCSN
jgi:adenosylhomocysteinase